MISRTLLLICLTLAGMQLQGQELKFLALGDSYTIGEAVPSEENWPHQLERRIEERGIQVTTQIIAKTGWRTDELINALDTSETDKPDMVSISIGVNNQFQKKPFGKFIEELDVLVKLALERLDGDTSAIFFVSIPDYSYTPFGSSLEEPTISTEIDEYNSHLAVKAKELKVPYVDVTSISRSEHASWVAEDDLHPSALQYEAWVDAILPKIEENLSAQSSN